MVPQFEDDDDAVDGLHDEKCGKHYINSEIYLAEKQKKDD